MPDAGPSDQHTAPDAPRTHLMLDVDTGIDDSLALLYLLASPEAKIHGIACTAGNVPVEQVAANNLNWLDVCSALDIEVALGARVPLVCALRTTEDTHGPQGIGHAVLPTCTRSPSERDATALWVDLARQYPGELVGLVTGPLTNLALAVREEPRLPYLLRRLVVMGGAFNHPGNTTPTSEWNVSVDPEAAKEVFDAFTGLPADRRPIVCGLDVTERIEMFPEHVRRLADTAGSTPAEIIAAGDGIDVRSTASNTVIRHLSDAVRFYMDFHRNHEQGFLAHMHDPFAAAVALDPSIVRTRPATVDVELTGRLTRGTTVADWAGHWNRAPNVDVAVAANPAAFFDDLIDRVGRYAKSVG